MKLVNKAFIVLAASTLIFAAGCKKKDVENAPVAEQAALLKAETPWVKSDVNALLTYIPEDSPIVMISTRELDMDSPAMQKILKRAADNFDKSIQESENQLSNVDADAKAAAEKILNTTKSMRPLIVDYVNNAADWGLDPKGHSDGAVYMVGKTVVMKLSVADSVKFNAKFGSTLESILSDTIKLADADLPAVKPAEVKAGNSTWKTFDITPLIQPKDGSCIMCQDGKSLLPNTVAMNTENNIITLAMVNGADTAVLESLLKPAEKPLDKSDLGAFNETTTGLGYIDNVKLFNVIAHSDAAAIFKDEDLLGQELTPVCEKDIAGIVSLFPKQSFIANLSENGEIKTHMTLALADKTELQALKDLTTSHLNIGSENSLATLALNIDINKTIAWMNSFVERANAIKYECEKLNPILPESIKEAAKSLNEPQIKLFTGAVSGLNAAVDKFMKKDGGNYEIEAVANISGPTLASSYPLITSLLTAGNPEIAGMLKLTKDESKDIDLTDIAGMPLKVTALLTDTEIVIGTPTYNVKTISAGKKENDGIILSLGLNPAVLAAFDLDVSAGDMSYKIELGLNDEGIVTNFIMK